MKTWISFIFAVVLPFGFSACGPEAEENLIDYVRPAGVALTPDSFEGVYNGDFESGREVREAIRQGEPTFTKIGIRLSRTQMKIHLRCEYVDPAHGFTTTADTWTRMPIEHNAVARTITTRATVLLRAHPAGAPKPCEVSMVTNQTSPYTQSDGILTLKGQFGVILEKKADL